MRSSESKFIAALFALAMISTTGLAESVHFGTKLTYSGATSIQMFSNLDFSAAGGSAGIRAANFGGSGDQVVGPTTFFDTSGTNGISWTGLTAGLFYNTPNSGDAGLNAVLSAGIHGGGNGLVNPPMIDITATPGRRYQVQLLVFSDFNSRQFDIFVDGVLFADEFESFFPAPGNPIHTIYRFDVIADADGLDIDLKPGSVFDPNPFVQGILVGAVVPLPSAAWTGLSLLVGLGVMQLIRRRRIAA